ncbi:MAG: CMP-N-acetylneuraminic acid synthetase/phosphoglycolate phosphatase-like HAD superfamily hydrolase [Psychromonas sp.]|jgi:CMP-N-acetylneuraminic acid synthetase/phosphoglycolate phosphatase-like HAD superfamily hydrolase|uniref:cytidylyltransferase domain-containing protein n=1 Tax=Psychromonas sp. TaxID=1884585 RepID=UPI0039E3FCEF
MKNLVALIAVRAGSQRVKNKNIRPFADSNLLEIKINQLKKVKQLDEIIVNSDCDKMLEIARKNGVTAIKREEKYASSEVGMSEVYQHFAEVTDSAHIMYANVTNPLAEAENYEEAISKYFSSLETNDSLASCHPIKEFLWKDGEAINYDTKNQPRSQDLPDIVALNFAISILPREVMHKKKNIIGEKPIFFVLDEIESVDIDTELDFYLAEKLYETLKINKNNLLEKKEDNTGYVFFDFDGVMFDSANEAYAVSMITSGKAKNLNDIDLESKHASKFMSQRYLIGPAWNYYYLLDAIDKGIHEQFNNYLPGQPSQNAMAFMQKFFDVRAELRTNDWNNWLSFNHKYDGVDEMLSILDENENTCIVTTKDKATVDALLKFNGVSRNVEIYDTKDYEEYGCKSYLIDKIITSKNIKNAIFIDDSRKHLDACKWIKNIKLVQAKWGYVSPSEFQDNKQDVINIIKETL